MRPDPDDLVQDQDTGELIQPAGFGWRWRDYHLVTDEDYAAHVVPLGDSRPHMLAETCPCRPQMNDAGVWLHRAWDGREAKEEKGIVQ